MIGISRRRFNGMLLGAAATALASTESNSCWMASTGFSSREAAME